VVQEGKDKVSSVGQDAVTNRALFYAQPPLFTFAKAQNLTFSASHCLTHVCSKY